MIRIMVRLDVEVIVIAQNLKMIDLFIVIKMNAKKDFMIYMAYALIVVLALRDAKHVMLLKLFLMMAN